MKRREFLAAMGFAVVLPKPPDTSVRPFVLNESQACLLRFFTEKGPAPPLTYELLETAYNEVMMGADEPNAGYWDGQLYVRRSGE